MFKWLINALFFGKYRFYKVTIVISYNCMCFSYYVERGYGFIKDLDFSVWL